VICARNGATASVLLGFLNHLFHFLESVRNGLG
jgi:hypothetical protein